MVLDSYKIGIDLRQFCIEFCVDGELGIIAERVQLLRYRILIIIVITQRISWLGLHPRIIYAEQLLIIKLKFCKFSGVLVFD